MAAGRVHAVIKDGVIRFCLNLKSSDGDRAKVRHLYNVLQEIKDSHCDFNDYFLGAVMPGVQEVLSHGKLQLRELKIPFEDAQEGLQERDQEEEKVCATQRDPLQQEDSIMEKEEDKDSFHFADEPVSMKLPGQRVDTFWQAEAVRLLCEFRKYMTEEEIEHEEERKQDCEDFIEELKREYVRIKENSLSP